MKAPDPSITDWAQVGLVALQLIVLVLAAFYARRQVQEATRLREEQARPFVVIDFDIKDHLIFIEVSNTGPSLARDVRFAIEPAFQSSLEGYQARDLKMFRDGISTLAPGKVIRTMFDSFPSREQQGIPDAYAVTITYADEKRGRAFTETLDLDIGLYRNVMSVRRHEIHHVNETLGKILGEMKRWRGPGNRGVLVLSPGEKRAESKRRRREFERAKRNPPFAPTEPTWRGRLRDLRARLPGA